MGQRRIQGRVKRIIGAGLPSQNIIKILASLSNKVVGCVVLSLEEGCQTAMYFFPMAQTILAS